MTKVVFLNDVRAQKKQSLPREVELDYQAKILGMEKADLLEEMIRFSQERSENGALTVDMMKRGKFLFERIEKCAETDELRRLSSSYRRHLSHELLAHQRRTN